MTVIANIVLCLSLFVHYGEAISAADLAEIKTAIFEDEKMKGLDSQLSDNIMTTGELVTALQYQETFVNELKEAHEREIKDLKLSYTTLEMYSKLTHCPNDGNFKTINGVCYLFSSEKKNYNDGKSFCESKIAMAKTGRLVEPKTTTIHKLIRDNAKTIFGNSFGYFIGVNDISSEGSWVYSSTGLSATTMFKSDQPNGGTTENCVDTGSFCGRSEIWCDKPCDTLREIVCEF